MRNLLNILLAIVFFSDIAFASVRCVDLGKMLEPSVVVAHSRVVVRESQDREGGAKLILSEKALNSDPDKGALELLRMLMLTKSFNLSDKNVLNKDKLILGLPLKEGYSLQLKYEADARFSSRFVIEAVELITPTGVVEKIAKEIVANDKLALSKTEFEIDASLLPAGMDVALEVPLTISGEPLIRLEKLTDTFELYTKDQLKKLVENTNSFAKVKTQFMLKRTGALFKKYFVAGPFKVLFNGIFYVAIAAGGLNYLKPMDNKVEVFPHEVQWVAKGINDAAGGKSPGSLIMEKEVKDQFLELRKLAEQQLKSKEPVAVPGLVELIVPANKYNFTPNHLTWVFEQKVAGTTQVKTFIIFSEEAPDGSIKILSVPIENPAQFAKVIAFIKNQGLEMNKLTVPNADGK